MNVRLVAYRNATTGAASESTYQLDLQEAPNVSLNFQFSEIKNPETRKGSYSHGRDFVKRFNSRGSESNVPNVCNSS
jgi:hypothetical protein